VNIKPIDPATLKDAQLKSLIARHKERRVFDETYRRAIEISAQRGSVQLDIATSLNVIRAAAAEGRFLSYLEVCQANGAAWDKVRFQLFKHLDDLLDHAHAHGLPLVTAIVVAKDRLKDGTMDERTRAGFVTGARNLGIVVTDEIAFAAEQQQATFAWAKEDAAASQAGGGIAG
jgi:hypothetical protein